ncbi:MAG TPA: formyltransferase family protein [Saprospiraceae bacterium]|nr:formyltransferase family protein [Saprospiraceae bacterium]
MTEKGFTVLKKIVETYSSSIVTYVCSDRDKNVLKDFYVEIYDYCKLNGISFYNRTQNDLPYVKYKIAISWKWIIKDTSNLIVFHDSLLPKYRGFNPLVTALINGDTQIGVTAIQAKEDVDSGNIIGSSEVSISYPIKIKDAIEIVSICYSELINSIIDKIVNNLEMPSIPQDESLASFSLWRDEDDYKIDWNDSANKIQRFIDAVGFPYKGAYSFVGDKLFKFHEVELLPDIKIANRTPGKVLRFVSDSPVIVCKEGLLLATKISDEDGNIYKLKNLRTRFL